jgi:ketose-bisphosphate aldolase
MGLVTLKYLLRKSIRERYVVGAFNFFGFENAQGIFQGAANKKSPVIAMASAGALGQMGINAVAGMVRGLAADYGVQAALHLDHATDYDLCRRCIDAGFTSVMIDASSKEFAENADITSRVVEYAARAGCSVEAELGHVGGSEDNITVDEQKALFTVPEDVVAFVGSTGIDALAVAVGTVHGFYKSAPRLDFERIAAIRAISDIPLVLHGGTGVSDDDLRKAASLGINKINVGTELKVHGYFDVMKRECIAANHTDPRKISSAIRDACAAIVEEKIDVFGSAGKGDEDFAARRA